MFKRTCWLLVAILLPIVLLVGIGRVEGLVRDPQEGTAVSDAPNFVINEIHADPHAVDGDANGDGTRDGTDDEFVEFINQSEILIDIGGWELHDSVGEKYTFPENTLVPNGCAVVVFGGATPTGDFGGSLVHVASGLGLNNGGDTVVVYDAGGTAVISYTYGAEGNDDQSLTRDPDITGTDPLVKHSTVTNASGSLFSPGTRTDSASFASCQPPVRADIQLEKIGQSFVQAGKLLTYTIKLENSGSAVASNVIVTDTLPTGMIYVSDDSGISPIQPDAKMIVWQLGVVSDQESKEFELTVLVDIDANGWLTNSITGTTSTEELSLDNNVSQARTYVGSGAILIEAVHYAGYEGASDEAVSLINISNQAVDVGGWRLSDGVSTAVIPSAFSISPGEIVWLANDAAAFKRQFGHVPDAAVNTAGSGIVVLSGSWPGFADDGDEVFLSNPVAQAVDVLVYEDGDTSVTEWSGTAVHPFAPHNALPSTGQILFRKRDQQTGLPVPDTDTAADWAQDRVDVINGRKVRYPGWDLEEFFFTKQIAETAVLTIAIAPDNASDAIIAEIDKATRSIQVEVQTIENHGIGDALVRAGNRGVEITIILEGQVTGQLGKISDDERYICQQIEVAGGACYFMISDSDNHVQDRYAYLHAKFMLFDEELALVSSENLSPNSFPYDDKSDGTWGRRGVVIITDASNVVSHLRTIFARDLDVDNHIDILRWQTNHPNYGAPPFDFVPIAETGGITYPIRYPAVTAVSGELAFEIIQSPENSLRDQDGLLGLVNKAGAGDTVWVQQLSERPFWGASASNAIDDPNPRLEAYINAARRGASVRILLDDYFNNAAEPNSNSVTCAYVDGIALLEKIKLECALANPTGLGIHNKMVLVQLGNQGHVHVGSINGTETSSKINRELALQVQSNEAYALLADMFDHDWPYRVYLPAIFNNAIGAANHILISEVQYNPPGDDDKEYVEIVNPTAFKVDISDFSLGDAVTREDFEDVRRFPDGTILSPGQAIVIATSATAFFAEFNAMPEFEILETETAVPNLIDDPAWGDSATFFQLGNNGDEIILRNVNDQVIDVVTYGSGTYPDVTACPLVSLLGAVLERFPYWQDTNICEVDFREWSFPSPGDVSN